MKVRASAILANSDSESADAIATVVAVEGPVKAMRVYRIITELSGTALRDVAAGALIEATKYAVRTKLIVVENQLGRGSYLGATLRTSDQPDLSFRVSGPRELDEIPDRELVAAANLVQAEDPMLPPDTLAKKTSLLFGYPQSTERFKEALVEALEKHGRE